MNMLFGMLAHIVVLDSREYVISETDLEIMFL